MLTLYKGNISLILTQKVIVPDIVPSEYIQNQINRDGDHHHITLILKNELGPDQDAQQIIEDMKILPNYNKFICIGLGRVKKGDDEVYYDVVMWPTGNFIRRKLGLKSKDLHITLGFKNKDIHDVPKNLTTILPEYFNKDLILNIASNFLDLPDINDKIELVKILDLLPVTNDLLDLRIKLNYMIKEYDLCLSDCLQILLCEPDNIENKMRMAHIYQIENRYYEAIHIFKELLNSQDSIIIKFANKGLNACYNKLQQTCNPRDRYIVEMPNKSIQLSRNFSWVIPTVLAGISIPKRKEEIEAFKFMNIGLVVSVLEEETLDPSWFDNDIKNIHYDVVNYCPPTMNDLLEIIEEMENVIKMGKGVVVHCGGGVGRAGSVLACFIIKHGLTGEIKENTYPVMSGSEAIAKIRELRPKSIETEKQENFIKEYSDYLWKNVK